MSEFLQSATSAQPSVRATAADDRQSLNSVEVLLVRRFSGRTSRCRLSCLELHQVTAHARDLGDGSATSRERCLRTNRPVADLPCERKTACTHTIELRTRVPRR